MKLTQILFSFNGRIPRQAFWLATLGVWGGSFVYLFLAAGIAVKVFGSSSEESNGGEALLAMGPPLIFLAWTQAAVLAKRLHDTGRTGWWVPFSVIPIVALWLLIEAGFVRGKPGENKYGADPLEKNI